METPSSTGDTRVRHDKGVIIIYRRGINDVHLMQGHKISTLCNLLLNAAHIIPDVDCM